MRTLSKSRGKRVHRALNRVAVACRDELVVLAPAARHAASSERRTQLLQQAMRRRTFLEDLGRGATTMGEALTGRTSYGARLWGTLRSVRTLATGPHQGDDYAVCARAAAKTARAYATALRLKLPPDIRFGLTRQAEEVDFDAEELRRLRWGASPSPARKTVSGPSEQRLARQAGADARALDAWGEDGGHASTSASA